MKGKENLQGSLRVAKSVVRLQCNLSHSFVPRTQLFKDKPCIVALPSSDDLGCRQYGAILFMAIPASEKKLTYRYYYDKPLDLLIKEEEQYLHPYLAERRAKYRQRMYGNLFCRDMRKILITENSVCANCASKDALVIDHIIPLSKGGANHISNTQVLCSSCNLSKGCKTTDFTTTQTTHAV